MPHCNHDCVLEHSQPAVPTVFLPEAREQTVLRAAAAAAAAGERTAALAVVQPSRRVAASEPGKGRGRAAVLGSGGMR